MRGHAQQRRPGEAGQLGGVCGERRDEASIGGSVPAEVVDRALEVEPGYRLALLISQALDAGMPPGSTPTRFCPAHGMQ